MSIKEEFIKELKLIKREGTDELLEDLEKLNFFGIMSSTGVHHYVPLAEHSLNVMRYACDAGKVFLKEEYTKYEESIKLCALLHDIGKCGTPDCPMYIPNILKSGKVSEAKPFAVNPDFKGYIHEVCSVDLAVARLKLSIEEKKAILLHGGYYNELSRLFIGNETRLVSIIHWADFWVSKFVETKKEIDDSMPDLSALLGI